VQGSCEHGNEPSGSLKCWENLEYLRNWRLLKKGSAPWSKLVSLFRTVQDCVNVFLILLVLEVREYFLKLKRIKRGHWIFKLT
jgi:hypothetical protein